MGFSDLFVWDNLYVDVVHYIAVTVIIFCTVFFDHIHTAFFSVRSSVVVG